MVNSVRNISVENLLAGRRFLIEWTLNDLSEGVTAYEIWRSTQEYQGFSKIGEVEAPTHQFIDKVPYTFGIVYFYKVIARNSAGVRSDISQTPAVQDTTFDDFEERPFRATTVSFDSFAVGEVPSGIKNGSNTAFITSSYFRFGTVQVFQNGLALARGVNFTEGSDQKTLTITPAPISSAVLIVNYLKV